MEPFEVPLAAFCYKCGAIIDVLDKGVLKKCPECGSKKIDTWGFEISKETPDLQKGLVEE